LYLTKKKSHGLKAGAAVAVSLALLLSGCAPAPEAAPASGEKTTLTFWTWVPTDEQFADLKTSFEKKYPDVTIDWTRTADFKDYEKKLQVALAGGDGPDLFGVQTGGMLEQYARFADPMDKLADKYMTGWKDTISENAVSQTTTSKGTVAAMPVIGAGMEYYLYNKTLLAENGITTVPSSYEELKNVSAQLKDKGIVSMAMGAKDAWHNEDFFVWLSQQYGPGDIYKADAGTLKWTDKTFVDTMNAWKELFTNGVFQDGALGTTTYPDARDNYFYARKSAFFPTGSWHVSAVIPNAETENTAVAKDEIGMAMFPKVGPKDAVATTGVDFALAVNKESEHKEAAMKFVDFMTMGEGQQIFVDTLQGSPVNTKVSATLPADASQTAKDSVALVTKANTEATYVRKLTNAKLDDAIAVALQEVVSGKSAEDALKDIQAVSDSITR
jgi:raffinose/stachyose/melibiose transport system substrate-binding protein